MTENTFQLPQAVYDGIIARARQGKPQEICGILSGRGNKASQLVRGQNVASDPINDYVIDSQTLLLQFDFEETGDEMVAIYHSHPITPAYPSASDAWSAHYPDCAYLICSLKNDAAPVLRAFRLIAHDQPFDLASLRAALDFFETRPGLFAFYQPDDQPIPPALKNISAHAPVPFYVIFQLPENEGKNFLSRVVSVIEHQIQITPDV
ncbi:MAG: M67 family metallopeptidase [Anaerolineae bacterium]